MREYGLTRGTCFLVYRLEMDAVAGLLWISWCVLGGADLFFRVFFFRKVYRLPEEDSWRQDRQQQQVPWKQMKMTSMTTARDFLQQSPG